MLQKMRDNAQGVAAKVLLGLLVVVFTMFGFGAFQAFIVTDPPAAKVNGEKISRAVLAQEMERQKNRILAQMGESANPDMIDTAQLQQTVLEQLINRQLVLEAADDMGLRTAPAVVDQAIVDNPQFQTNGHFDRDLYQRLLANVGHSPASFKDELTNNITVVQLSGAVTETPFVTEQALREAARMVAQKRDFAYVDVSPDRFKDQVAIADEDIEGFYEAHRADFMTPEMVDVDYVRLSLDAFDKQAAYAPTDDEITARYEANKAAYTPAEQRRISHILLKVGPNRTEAQAREQLAGVARRLQKGEKFEDIAREISEDPGSASNGGDLGFVAQGALVPEFEQAAFALAPGAISDPVKTEFGMHLIKVDEIRTEAFPTLAQQHDEIADQIRREKAETDYRDKVRGLDELAFESPDGLDQLVQLTGNAAQHAADVTRNSGPSPFDNASLRTAAFSEDVLTRGLNSRVIEVGENAYVLRVSNHREPGQRTLAEVTPDIRARLTSEAAAEKARQAADDIVAKVEAGEGTATSAAAYGLNWQVVAGASRASTGHDPVVLEAAFDLPRPTAEQRSVTSTPLRNGDIAVITVTAVTDGDYAALTEAEIDAIRNQLSRRLGDDDFQSMFQSLREAASIERI
jgi:peptidyl-prolyl cis-trans isomerase D